jgi:hypothetical protein
MITILSALVSLLSFQLRSRASLELEVVALRHQVAVLRRQRSGRLRLAEPGMVHLDPRERLGEREPIA